LSADLCEEIYPPLEDPFFGAAGIGILAFHLLDPVPLSAGREFHKIVARFYFYNQMIRGSTWLKRKN
jgi:hypothetical protein